MSIAQAQPCALHIPKPRPESSWGPTPLPLSIIWTYWVAAGREAAGRPIREPGQVPYLPLIQLAACGAIANRRAEPSSQGVVPKFVRDWSGYRKAVNLSVHQHHGCRHSCTNSRRCAENSVGLGPQSRNLRLWGSGGIRGGPFSPLSHTLGHGSMRQRLALLLRICTVQPKGGLRGMTMLTSVRGLGLGV